MKKVFSIVFAVITMFAFVIIPVQAQEEEGDDFRISLEKGWVQMDGASDAVQNTPNGGQNADKLAGKSMYGTMSVLFTAIAPQLLENAEEIPDQAMRKGLVGMVDDGIIALFDNQPRIDVVAHLAEEWVPGYKDTNAVYANGYSDLSATGITQLWSTTRNIAYAFYVVIMIIIGFMIMFRNKIGGQMMVTIGNSIPKIIISLVLVTFSFAIIGIIIDVAGVARNIIEAIYYAGDPSDGIDVTNVFKLFGGVFSNSAWSQAGAGTALTGGVVLGIGKHLLKLVADGVLVGTAGAGAAAGGLVLLLLGLIVLGIVLVGAVKLWITLLKAHFGLLVNVITAPLTIMMSSIPGNDAAMWNTFKSALRNALVFPIAYAIVNLPFYLANRGLTLTFPATLTGADDMNPGSGLATLLIGVAKIIAIYTAASAPEIVKGIIPATAPKSGIDIGKSLSESMGKVPLIGGMFKG